MLNNNSEFWNQYTEKENIFSGTIYTIYKVKNKITGKYEAIKEINKEKYEINIENLKKDLQNLKRINSENLITIKQIIDTKYFLYIIMDLCIFNMEKFLKIRKKPFSINEIRQILNQLNKALIELNNNQIYHGNIKLSNIIISLDDINNIEFKLSLFNINKYFMNLELSVINKISLSTSPEIIEKSLINNKNDIWSL